MNPYASQHPASPYNRPSPYGGGMGGGYGPSSRPYGSSMGGAMQPYQHPQDMRQRYSQPDSYFHRYNPMMNYNYYEDQPLMLEDRIFDDENVEYERPTYRRSKMLANPDFGNFHYKKGYTAEVWLNDGETVVLSADSRKKTYRTHYSPEYLRSFFFGWIGRLLRYFYLDRLFGLHIDTVKTVRTKNYVFVSAHLLPT